ncbi:methionyl aminopeptidase [Chitinophaga terrae (ex Kim and Jung 2007)]|jgi:methionyl aminopeptidase|uniref:Methionine aminopeptidase n=1 Tax=Chitinophaga terrae (ex Kim and Jung 2007) TaxID=408074 RepID=A0A1H4B8M3_9BACT|nr:type I methionyl aminopeptidase [Chitinophaga terrae (ex Kim and Jung 2007)]MDQ0106298.1 methionyl aminopeptidase [Chitinophaga terrae (ex Kim and Jung 2007)]GEP91235.1 methionine aminopeptidase 2 [Chitinophaga terrae (ex Kim and Jung 2007)]SEA44467.1 methionyl aminopeptidase [Chitinophaga terrae (ex Kim and Jung 2007)]
MSITNQAELEGMKKVSEVVAVTLKAMREYAQPGMSTKQLDDYGYDVLKSYGARSAPYLTYRFPGCTCISVNNEVAHGIPSAKKYIQEGDLINIDVSAELNGFWADNGGSFVLGADIHKHQKLVDASKAILHKAIQHIKSGVKIRQIGRLIETEAAGAGFTVIRNLGGHGVGRSLHEEPEDVLNCYSRYNRQRFQLNSVVAIETFISTKSNIAAQLNDGWTLVGNKGGFVAQHEHTIVVTDKEPIILTAANGIWN